MPPRLNKRQQRELEELEALGGSSKQEVSSEDEQPIPQGTVGGFSNFLTTEDVGVESEGEGSVRHAKSRKKKKKKTTTTVAPPPIIKSPRNTTPVATPVIKNEKKALKKAKAKERKAGNDELEQALAELSMKYPELQKVTNVAPDAQSLANLLSVSLTHLDSEAEMRKFFGAKVVQANKPGSSARRQAATQRSNLTRPQPSWWASKQREGLSIRVLTQEELALKPSEPVDEKWWTVDYSKRYTSATKAFIQSVMAGDPEAFWELLKKLPWHADTLLQLAEVFRHREEYSQAVDFVDRAIFTYERAFIGAFTFTSGVNRLDFDRVENRPFFLAIHRQITDLQRRGCVRTAFEFARLLYSLDPWNDPHGALYHLDLLALKCGMGQWLLDVYDLFTNRREKPPKGLAAARMNPSILPGWAYGRALALKMQEDSKKDKNHIASTAALKEAISSFPSIVPLLADKLDVSIPTSIRAHRDFRVETDASSLSAPIATLHLLSHLYVQRSMGIWKESEYSSWFADTVTAAFSSLPSNLPITEQRETFLSLFQHQNIQYSAYRHVMVLETTYRRLLAFIPRQVTEAKSLACDPLPPPTSVTQYNEEFFEGVEDMFASRPRTRRERALDNRRLEQMIPDPNFRAQFQVFFDGHPDLVQRFPGGVLQFAQAAGELPADVLEEMMLMQAMRDGDEMPGQMPGLEGVMLEEMLLPGDMPPGGDENFEDVDGDEDEDEDEEEEYVSPMPRVLRNLLGRFWGRTPVDDDSSDDELPAPVDDTGVD